MACNDLAVFDLEGKRVWVAGASGMVGSALVRRLQTEPCELLSAYRSELDLTDFPAVARWFDAEKPDAVFVAAARVGGLLANDAYPADFISENLAIALNTINASHRAGVQKLVFLGSSCVYPRETAQPIQEAALLSGPLEPTNQWYAIAKIAGTKLCQAYRRQYGCEFITVMPSNLYGPGDNYHPEDSHVPAALIRRFHEAKSNRLSSACVWGSGTPRREFMHVDDLADACVFIMEQCDDEEILNVGTGRDISIREFARLVADVVGFKGEIVFNPERPDGAPRKLLDVSRLEAMGWRSTIGLREGITSTYESFLKQAAAAGCIPGDGNHAR